MQSSTYRPDNSYIPLGERRGKSDLARFSLDLSWARAVSDSARARAYPSPPMSGSPPLPPRRNPDSSDRSHGSYGSSGQDVFRGAQTPLSEHSEQTRAPSLRGYVSDPLPPAQYGPYRMEGMPSAQLQYHHQQPQMALQQQHNPYPQQVSAPFSAPDRPQMGEAPEYSSPKQSRKTKGHVASACVPCKRAHLRCDAQRPCSRCLSNGKEDTCVDVQHKKRGRPRLRDEREPRYEGLGPHYPPPPHESMRRPLSLYPPGDPIGTQFGDPLQRGSSYRVLKSQSGPMGSRPIEYGSPMEVGMYGGSMAPTPRMLPPQESVCAYLTMDMQIAKATQSFGETIGLQSVVARKFQDIVTGVDREKVLRLQRIFEEERREREPNYLPPIYLKYEEDRVIQSVGFSVDEMSQLRPDRQEMFTFQGPDGQQRTFQVRFGLAKKESTYFVVLLLHIPATPQTYHQPSSSPYSREPQYGYQTPQQPYTPNPNVSPFMANPQFGDPRAPEVMTYRTPGPLGQNIPPSNMPPFVQAPTRQDYSQTQNPFQTPRSEMTQAQPQRQHDLQLPPIRDQGPSGRRDDRSGRVDIGGLLEKPDHARRGT